MTRARRAASIVICLLPCVLALAGCLNGENETDKHRVLRAYTDCLNQAAAKMDDGKSEAATIAKVISPMCAAAYEKVIQVNNTQNQKDFAAAMQAKQLDFATTVVSDRRK